MTAGVLVDPGLYDGKVDSLTALFNAYVDLGNWGGLTPYVGAGIGASRTNVRELSAMSFPAASNGSNVGLVLGLDGGASIRSCPTVLDLGYRYLISAMRWRQRGQQRNPFKDMSRQEVRVGLRFMID